jgi:hypothetical protein
MRKSQVWSIETFIAVGIFFMAIVFFFVLINMNNGSDNFEKESEGVAKRVEGSDIFKDGMLTDDELNNLSSLSCAELKSLFSSKDNICIYLKDGSGNYINITGKETLGIGCPGFNVSGVHGCG